MIDGRAMDGVTSFRIHSGPDMTHNRCLIRWTEVFLISSSSSGSGSSGSEQPSEPARASEGVARSVCVALLPSLEMIRSQQLSPLAVRVATQPDNVSTGFVK